MRCRPTGFSSAADIRGNFSLDHHHYRRDMFNANQSAGPAEWRLLAARFSHRPVIEIGSR